MNNFVPNIRAEKAYKQLSAFVQLLVSNGIDTHLKYLRWKKKQEEKMSEIFLYDRQGQMPSITTLVNAVYHPELPIVLLNYTQGAQAALMDFPQGWTEPLCHARGAIFDLASGHEGETVAAVFPKMFNYAFEKHVSTYLDPNWPKSITVKLDGHLGIVFRYNQDFHITTRGSFVSASAELARQMLSRFIIDKDWHIYYPKNVTTLVEIIHPQTKVYVDYNQKQRLPIIGAINRVNLFDYDYGDLQLLGKLVGLPIAAQFEDRSITDLQKIAQDPAILNCEGVVIRAVTPQGEVKRIKIKFRNYLEMVNEAAISFGTLMRWLSRGELSERLLLMRHEEAVHQARLMLGYILEKMSLGTTQREKWTNLYELQPLDTKDVTQTTFRNTCREFVKMYFPALPR